MSAEESQAPCERVHPRWSKPSGRLWFVQNHTHRQKFAFEEVYGPFAKTGSLLCASIEFSEVGGDGVTHALWLFPPSNDTRNNMAAVVCFARQGCLHRWCSRLHFGRRTEQSRTFTLKGKTGWRRRLLQGPPGPLRAVSAQQQGVHAVDPEEKLQELHQGSPPVWRMTWGDGREYTSKMPCCA